MRPASILVALAAAATLSGCGGGGEHPPAVQGPIVKGPNGVWIFQPAEKPKALVIFFHGQGGFTEATPANHRPWIDHLVAQGDAVIYPRYELEYERAVLDHAVEGIRTAIEKAPSVKDLPVAAIGYSRGGALAVEYAAVARREQVPVPKLVASIFTVPEGDQARIVDLAPIDPHTRLVLFIGDRDPGGAAGAQGLLGRLRNGGFPGERIGLRFVRSRGGFSATHLSFLQSTAGAQAAFWRPLDALVAKAES